MGNFATTTSFDYLLVRFYKSLSSTTDTFGSAQVSAHIDRAESLVMSSLAARYSMPFTTVPPEVRRISEDIASVYIIRSSNYQDGKEKNQYLENFEKAFYDLKQLSEGARKLTLTNGSLVSQNTAGRFKSSSLNYTPIFGLDDPINWERDSDEIEDQSEARE